MVLEQQIEVAVVGTYCAMNKGDATMQQVFMHQLHARREQVRAMLSSPFPSLNATRTQTQAWALSTRAAC